MFPKARKNQIKVRELADETMVYDKERGKAHCLNATAAFVWRHCDGRTSIAQLAELVQQEFGIDQAQALVRLALEQLSSRHLLEEPVVSLSGAARHSRRDVLKKLAVAAVAIPLVMTITAKSARAGASAPACVGKCQTECTYGPTGNLNIASPNLTTCKGHCLECTGTCPPTSSPGNAIFVSGDCVISS